MDLPGTGIHGLRPGGSRRLATCGRFGGQRAATQQCLRATKGSSATISAGTASCTIQPYKASGASAPHADEGTYPGRRSTSVDRQSGQGIEQDRKPRSTHPSGQQVGQTGPERTEITTQNVFAQEPLDGTSTPLPWERRSFGRGRRSGQRAPGSFGSQNAAKKAGIASDLKIAILVRQETSLGWGDRTRAHANRTRTLRCPPVEVLRHIGIATSKRSTQD